jgi:hypothetical protein
MFLSTLCFLLQCHHDEAVFSLLRGKAGRTGKGNNTPIQKYEIYFKHGKITLANNILNSQFDQCVGCRDVYRTSLFIVD